MKSHGTLLCALLAIAGAGFAWRANLQLRATKAALVDAAAARAQITAESAQASKRIEEAKTGAELEAELVRLNAAGPTRALSPAFAANAPASARRESTPREDATHIAQFRGRLAPRYSEFYRAMGFSPEQAAKFEDLLTEQESRRIDFRAAARSSAVALSVTERNALVAKEDARAEAEQRQLLGDAGYERLQDYEAGSDHRRIVRELVSELALTASPLSVEQGRQLGHVLADVRFQGRAGATAEQWAPVFARAQNFLSPAQLAELHVVARKSHYLAALNGLSQLVQETKQ